jgi:hypothetical protein
MSKAPDWAIIRSLFRFDRRPACRDRDEHRGRDAAALHRVVAAERAGAGGVPGYTELFSLIT